MTPQNNIANWNFYYENPIDWKEVDLLGSFIISDNAKYTAEFQRDGTLAIYVNIFNKIRTIHKTRGR